MILLASYWKKPLLATAKRLRKYQTAGELSARTLAQVEKDIFFGFYSIRKLVETIAQVTDESKKLRVDLIWYKSRNRRVNWINYLLLEKLYDLTKKHKENRDIVFVYNQIIHSFVFSPVENDYGLDGIYFASDQKKNEKLYYLPIRSVIEIYERFGNEEIMSVQWKRHESGEGVTVVR